MESMITFDDIGIGDSVEVAGRPGKVINVDEDEGALVTVDGAARAVWVPFAELTPVRLHAPTAVFWTDRIGMKRVEYFPAGDTRTLKSARYHVLSFYDVASIDKVVTDITSYGDFIDKYGKH